jgi:hypothetical protein
MLVSSALAGLLWDSLGSAFTFYAGAGFAALTLLGLVIATAAAARDGPGRSDR